MGENNLRGRKLSSPEGKLGQLERKGIFINIKTLNYERKCKNIGQKGNENRELYNNNLKVVNHMEKTSI